MLRRTPLTQGMFRQTQPNRLNVTFRGGNGPETPTMDPELTKYASATFSDGHARVKPKMGEESWTDARAWPKRFQVWIRTPVYKGTVISAWAMSLCAMFYLQVLNQDAKATYHHNTAVTRSLHMEALKAQEAQERLAHLQRSLTEHGIVTSETTGSIIGKVGELDAAALAKAKKVDSALVGQKEKLVSDDPEPKEWASGGSTRGTEGPDRRELRKDHSLVEARGSSASGIVNWELDLSRAKFKNDNLAERNQFLVTELGKLRTEFKQVKKSRDDLEFEVRKLQAYVEKLQDPYGSLNGPKDNEVEADTSAAGNWMIPNNRAMRVKAK